MCNLQITTYNYWNKKDKNLKGKDVYEKEKNLQGINYSSTE